MKSTPFLATGLAATGALALVLLASTSAPATASAPLFANGPIPIDSLPFHINAPGTYCLTANLTGQTQGTGIVVLADGVTIDLGGFELSGGGVGGTAIYNPQSDDLTVCNGRVTDWTFIGITSAHDVHVFDVVVRGTCEYGLTSSGTAVIERVRVHGNMSYGVRTGFGSIVRDSQITLNTLTGTALRLGLNASAENVVIYGGALGVDAYANSSLRNCDVHGAGTWCIQTSDRVSLIDVDVYGGCAGGIELQNSCTVRSCDIDGFMGDGLSVVGRDNRIEGNNIRDNATGLRVLNGHNLVVRNMAFGNGVDFVIAPLNSVGPILRDFMTISSTSPHANHGTPLL